MPRIDFALSPIQRIQAREFFRLCEAANVDPLETVRRGLEGRRVTNRLLTIEVVRMFMQSRVDADCRPATLDFYGDFLKPVVGAFGDRVFDTITRQELADCIDSATTGKTARTSIARASRALWRWAMTRRDPMAATDATAGLKFIVARKEGREISILTVEQCSAILAGAGRFKSALALMLYAGIRPEEIRGPDKPPLQWKHVSIDHGAITIPAACAKSRRKRIIEGLPAAIWQWLEPARAVDPVAPTGVRAAIERARELAELDQWPQDCTRHTFASYMMAYTANPGQVAFWLGHEESLTMLYRHYHRPGLKSVAQRFLDLCNVGASCPVIGMTPALPSLRQGLPG